MKNPLLLGLIALISLISLISRSTAVRADVAPEPPDGKKFIGTSVEFEGLDSDTYVILGWDEPFEGKISQHLTFTKDRARLEIAHGRGRDGVYGPSFHLMTAASHKAWFDHALVLIDKQRDDCMKGHGCAHISRFSPRYPAPTDAIDCHLSVTATLTVPEKGPDAIIARVKVVELGPKVCRLELITDGREALAEPVREVPKAEATLKSGPGDADSKSLTPERVGDVAGPTPEHATDGGRPTGADPISQTAAKRGCESGGATSVGLLIVAAWFSRRRR